MYVRTRVEHEDEVRRVTHYPAVSCYIHRRAKIPHPPRPLICPCRIGFRNALEIGRDVLTKVLDIVATFENREEAAAR